MSDRIKRRATTGEHEMLFSVFRGKLKCSSLVIVNYDRKHPEETRSFAHHNRVHLLGGKYAADLSTCGDMHKRSTFIHECAHVWQYQNHITSGQDEMDGWFKSGEVAAKNRIKEIEATLFEETRNVEKRHGYSAATKYLEKKKTEISYLETRASENAKKVGMDKRAFIENKLYDPIYNGGPVDTFVNYKWVSEVAPAKPDIGKRMSANEKPPHMGERMSDYMWRVGIPEFKALFGTLEKLKAMMKRIVTGDDGTPTATINYNYMMLLRLGYYKFLDLRHEAQAALIGEYYLIKNGVDPRTVIGGGYSSFKRRPELKFYEEMLKGILL